MRVKDLTVKDLRLGMKFNFQSGEIGEIVEIDGSESLENPKITMDCFDVNNNQICTITAVLSVWKGQGLTKYK